MYKQAILEVNFDAYDFLDVEQKNAMALTEICGAVKLDVVSYLKSDITKRRSSHHEAEYRLAYHIFTEKEMNQILKELQSSDPELAIRMDKIFHKLQQ